MKRFFTLFLILLTGSVLFFANALTFYVTVDDPANVNFQKNFSPTTLQAGRNTFNEASSYCSVAISAANGAEILSITKNGNPKGTRIDYDTVNDGDEYVITTQGAQAQAKSFTVNVTDNPELVWIIKNGDWMSTNLKDASATQKIEFTNSDNPFSIKYYYKDNKNYSGRIYQVKVGDEPLTPDASGAFSYTATDGDIVTITVNTPAETRYPVHFNVSESAEGFIKEVKVNGETATNWADDDFDVEAGSSVSIYCDTENYKVEAFKINGVTASLPDGCHTFTVSQETTVEANARQWYSWPVSINTENPELIEAYIGSSVGGIKINLEESNAVEVSERNPKITVLAKTGSDLDEVTFNGQPVEINNNECAVLIDKAGTIEVSASLIQRNYKATVYVSDISYADNITFNRNNAAMSDIFNLEQGYQWVEFYEKDNPHILSLETAGIDYHIVRHNYTDLEQAALSSDETYDYSISLSDGDLVQIYLGHAPIEYNVSFELQGEISNLKVVRDYTYDFDPATAADPLIVPYETAFEISADEPVTIKVNDNTIAEDTQSETLFVGNKDENKNYKITISGKGVTGINEISGEENAEVRYFNLQGIRLSDKPTAPGVYLRQSANGTEKIIIK